MSYIACRREYVSTVARLKTFYALVDKKHTWTEAWSLQHVFSVSSIILLESQREIKRSYVFDRQRSEGFAAEIWLSAVTICPEANQPNGRWNFEKRPTSDTASLTDKANRSLLINLSGRVNSFYHLRCNEAHIMKDAQLLGCNFPEISGES